MAKWKKEKRTNNDMKKTTQKTNYRTTLMFTL